MKKKTLDVLRLALECAISDRQNLADAYGNDETEAAVIQANKHIAEFKQLQKMLFGSSETEFDKAVKDAKSFSFIRWLVKYPELTFDEFIATNDYKDNP